MRTHGVAVHILAPQPADTWSWHCGREGVEKVPIQSEYTGRIGLKNATKWHIKLEIWTTASKDLIILDWPIIINILSLTSSLTNPMPAMSEWCHGTRPTEASVKPFHQTLTVGNAESHNFWYTISQSYGPTDKFNIPKSTLHHAGFANIFRSDGHLFYTFPAAVLGESVTVSK